MDYLADLEDTIRGYLADFTSADIAARQRSRMILPGLLAEWCELTERDELLVESPSAQLAEFTSDQAARPKA